jgi:hypothetical protein
MPRALDSCPPNRGKATAACLALFLLAAPPSKATLYKLISLEDAVVNSGLSLTDNGTNYSISKNGDYDPPRIVTDDAYAGSRSLYMHMAAHSTTNALSDGRDTDRTEYKIMLGSEENTVKFDGVGKYVGYAFKLDANFEPPASSGSVIICQSLQGAPIPSTGVPLIIKLLPGYSNPFHLEATTSSQDGGEVVRYRGDVVYAGVWNTLVVYQKLSWTGNTGELQVWLNGISLFSVSGINIGFDPSLPNGWGTTNYCMDVKFGIYQHRPNTDHGIHFDQIAFASTYAEADPAGYPHLTSITTATSAGGLTNAQDITLKFTTKSGRIYRLEATSDLGNPASWTPLRTNIFGTGAEITLEVPDESSPRYYRIRSP